MTIAVVSNDAGSSEILCSFISHHHNQAAWAIFALPKSPMAHICERHNLPFTVVGNAALQLETLSPDVLLFGTGWQDKPEREYVAYAKSHGIPTVAFLDHWTSYRERFGYPEENWDKNCGDFTAVVDEKALRLAIFHNLPHPLSLPNYYLRDLVAHAQNKTITPNQNLLFLSEPTEAVALHTHGDKNYWGFTQYTALEEILKNFEKFGCTGLTIRLHPSDTGHGYRKILKKFSHVRAQINDAASFDLTNQLLSAKMILGFDTMALYTAALMGKPVLSYLPSQNRKFLLPLSSECQVRDLASVKTSLLAPIPLDMDDFGMDFALFLKTIAGIK